MVAVIAVAVVARVVIVSRTIAASKAAVAQSGTDIVAVSVIESVVVVVVVVIVVGGHPVVVMPPSVTVIPIVMMVRVMISPTPTIGKAVVIPSVTIIIWAVCVAGPPPIVAHINAYAPVIWVVIVPIEIGVEGIVIPPSAIEVAVETADTGGVIIVIVIVLIVIVVGDVGVARGCGRLGSASLRILDERLADAGIVGFGVNQRAVLVIFIYNGIGLYDIVARLIGFCCSGFLRHGSLVLLVLGRGVDVIIIGIRAR